MTPHDRFQVCDPELKELILAFQSRYEAFQFARKEAQNCGYGLEVFDVMAHRNMMQLWRVSPTGEIQGQLERKP